MAERRVGKFRVAGITLTRTGDQVVLEGTLSLDDAAYLQDVFYRRPNMWAGTAQIVVEEALSAND